MNDKEMFEMKMEQLGLRKYQWYRLAIGIAVVGVIYLSTIGVDTGVKYSRLRLFAE